MIHVFILNKQQIDTANVYLLLYVNDILVASTDKKQIKKIKETLGPEFEMKDLGQARKIL